MKAISIFFLMAIYAFPSQLSANNTGKIEAMQMPAWIKHSNGEKEPLTPGLIIQSGDHIITGKASRLVIRLKEGSHVKLGENTHIHFSNLQAVEAKQGVFSTTINLIKGAFRFTTTAFGRNKKRDIKIKTGVITATIKGTDILARSNTEHVLLCLLEGAITAQRDGEPEFSMYDPLSYYLVPHNKPADPIQTAPQNKLAQWAAQTELLNGGGVLAHNGKWIVNLMSLDSLEATQPVTKQFADSGYATDVERFISQGRNWYRIRIKGFKTYEDAKIFSTIVDNLHGTHRPWVGKSE